MRVRFAQFASRPYTREDLDRLTEEEEQVLIMRRRGKSVVQVADALCMSAESVYRRERSIRSKLL